MSNPTDALTANPAPQPAPTLRGWRFQMRFAAIWIAMVGLIVFCAIVAPRSLLPSTFLAIIPLAAFLAITAIGETLVLMARGIDLSIPAVITLSSTIVLGFSGGHDEAMLAGVLGALFFATIIGLINGVLVAVFELNALIVTLAVGAITTGATLWYRDSLPQELRVPPGMAAWGDERFLGLNFSVWIVAALAVILNLILRKTTVGRHFSAVGANPRAAWIAGINVAVYQTAAFTVAAFLYGIAGVLSISVHPQPDAEGRRALSAGADCGRRSWRYGDVGRHRQHGRRCRRCAVSHATRPNAANAWPLFSPSICHPRDRDCAWHGLVADRRAARLLPALATHGGSEATLGGNTLHNLVGASPHMALMATWEITITCRDGSRLRFSAPRRSAPQKGEIV